MQLLCFHRGIVSLLLLKTQLVKKCFSQHSLCSSFYLKPPVCNSCELCSSRLIIVSTVFPSILASVLVDAFPQQLRRRVTLVTYAVMITWIVAFAVALLGSFIGINESLVLHINHMEFSAKSSCTHLVLVYSFSCCTVFTF